MGSTLSAFSTRLRNYMSCSLRTATDIAGTGRRVDSAEEFEQLALELFALQFQHNAPYRRLCESRGASPGTLQHWTAIPAVPTVAFKELELSCLPVSDRSRVFFSSGTTLHRPSRHFHSAGSLEIYEAALLGWFERHLISDNCPGEKLGMSRGLALTPNQTAAPHSSLVHMFETIRQSFRFEQFMFAGATDNTGAWQLNCHAATETLQQAVELNRPILLLGTAFSYVHLLDYLAEQGLKLKLPPGTRVLETGGYKGRSRAVPKSELHWSIASHLGVTPSQIVGEYGMSELSSQAYDGVASGVPEQTVACEDSPAQTRHFHFPPWARLRIVSPETGQPVPDGQAGLIQVFDLANVYSVMAIQTEDIAVARGDGFDLVGRAASAEARGCSLLSQSA
jgi:hypothetical protein